MTERPYFLGIPAFDCHYCDTSFYTEEHRDAHEKEMHDEEEMI